MDPSLASWHLIGFIAPALGVAALTAAGAKLMWRRDLRGIAWWRLTGIASLGGLLTMAVGLVGFGHDGEMTTYAALVASCATLVWWFGFR